MTDEIRQAAALAVAARRAWSAAPTDHDHHLRHQASDEYHRAERHLIAAVLAWVSSKAKDSEA